MNSPWISRLLKGFGHKVLVANPRKVRAIYSNVRKCDRKDAEMLARLARCDEKLLYPIEHSTEQAQRDLLRIKLRDNLVRQRVDVISAVRFTLKSMGIRLRSPKTGYFARYARKELAGKHAGILALIEPSLFVLDAMTSQIRELEKAIEEMAVKDYPQTQLLQGITGVGTITSLTFVLTIRDPNASPGHVTSPPTSAWCPGATSPETPTNNCAFPKPVTNTCAVSWSAPRSTSSAPSARTVT